MEDISLPVSPKRPLTDRQLTLTCDARTATRLRLTGFLLDPLTRNHGSISLSSGITVSSARPPPGAQHSVLLLVRTYFFPAPPAIDGRCGFRIVTCKATLPATEWESNDESQAIP